MFGVTDPTKSISEVHILPFIIRKYLTITRKILKGYETNLFIYIVNPSPGTVPLWQIYHPSETLTD